MMISIYILLFLSKEPRAQRPHCLVATLWVWGEFIIKVDGAKVKKQANPEPNEPIFIFTVLKMT